LNNEVVRIAKLGDTIMGGAEKKKKWRKERRRGKNVKIEEGKSCSRKAKPEQSRATGVCSFDTNRKSRLGGPKKNVYKLKKSNPEKAPKNSARYEQGQTIGQRTRKLGLKRTDINVIGLIRGIKEAIKHEILVQVRKDEKPKGGVFKPPEGQEENLHKGKKKRVIKGETGRGKGDPLTNPPKRSH